MLKHIFLVTGFVLSVVTFGQAPVAGFSSVPATVGGIITLCQGSTITFNNTSNQTVAGTTYLWNFGLGATPATANTAGPHTVSYNTATAPTTTVTLTVTNPGFAPSIVTGTIDVNALPNAALTLASTGGGYGTTTQNGQTIFKNCGSIDSVLFTFNSAVNNTVTQVFNWGDGSTSTNLSMGGSQISHDYPLGQFVLTHTVTQNGCTNTASFSVFNGSAPQVSVSGIGSNTCLPSPYTFDILSNDVPITYTVNFSDGTPSSVFTTSNDTTINHIFTTSSCGVDYVFAPGFPPIPNAFSASIAAQNMCSFNGIPTLISVGPIVLSTGTTAEFSYTPQSPICVLEPVTFTNEAVAGESVSQAGCDTTYGYYWEITPNTFTVINGSLGSSNGFTGAAYDHTQWTNGSDNLEIIFSQPGTHNIKLTTGTSCGHDTIVEVINVFQSDTLIIYQSAIDSFTLNGTTYTQSGVYTQIIPSVNSCDSIITLNLTLGYTELYELNSTNKKLIKLTDVTGKMIGESKNTFLIYMYSDGTVERKFVVEF